MNTYYDLGKTSRKKIIDDMCDILFIRCPYTIISSKYIGGGYNPKSKKLANVKFICTVRLEKYVSSQLQSVVDSAKDRVLQIVKKRNEKDWTLREPTMFVIDNGNKHGNIVCQVSGNTLRDFWFVGGQVYVKLNCRGY